MEFQHFIRHVNTKEQMADILAKGSFLVLSGMMGLVNMCAPPSEKISICTPSQGQKFPHRALFSWYVPMLQKRKVNWSTDMTSVSSPTRRPKAMAFSASTSSDAGRDPVAATTSREVAGGDTGELSPRRTRKERREAALHTDLHRKYRRDTLRRATVVSTHIYQSVVERYQNSLNAKPGQGQHPRSRGDFVCVLTQRFPLNTHHE